jgi:DNA-directed RNA polymerase specialized sigma24 family protein
VLSDARSYLLRYGDLKLYIAAKRREIETLRESLLPQSVDYTGVTVQHSPSDHYAEIMAQIDQIERKIQDQTTEALKALEEITDTISKISDYSHRALLINYYVNGMTWEMTAEVMGFEVRTIYRMHDDALEEIEKILCQ